VSVTFNDRPRFLISRKPETTSEVEEDAKKEDCPNAIEPLKNNIEKAMRFTKNIIC
jgi:hypothetical protein